MNATSTPTLYVKTGCPWCAEAKEVLDRRGIERRTVTVTGDAQAFAQMEQISGQTKAPVLVWGGDVLADFGAAELEPWLDARGVARGAS